MWLVIGLGSMGLLVGFLAGMSSSEIVKPIITLLFAFVGGSIFVVLTKLSGEDRNLAGKMLASLSLFCAIGLSVGLIINRHQLFVPADIREKVAEACLSTNPPAECTLRAGTLSQVEIIDQKLHAQPPRITIDQAYEQLHSLLQQPQAEDSK